MSRTNRTCFTNNERAASATRQCMSPSRLGACQTPLSLEGRRSIFLPAALPRPACHSGLCASLPSLGTRWRAVVTGPRGLAACSSTKGLFYSFAASLLFMCKLEQKAGPICRAPQGVCSWAVCAQPVANAVQRSGLGAACAARMRPGPAREVTGSQRVF